MKFRRARFVPHVAGPVACAICGGGDTRPVCVKFGLRIARCRRCDLVYATPRVSLDEIRSRYTADYFRREYLPSLGIVGGGPVNLDPFERRYSPLLALLHREMPRPGRLLEIGSGAGMFLKVAERRGWTVVGTDLSEEAVGFARGLGLDVRQETAEALSCEPQSFDVAVLLDTIEHLIDPMAVMRAVHRALRPGGAVVISTPNFEALSRFALGRAWSIISPTEHLYYFTEATLTKLLEGAGFHAARVDRTFAINPYETMNSHWTHNPRGWRAYAYKAFVHGLGPRVWRVVQKRGRSDHLVCIARA